MEFKDLIIILGILIILFLLTCFTDIENDIQNNYIHNLEEKVNILTVDYEEFSLEDSLKQERI